MIKTKLYQNILAITFCAFISMTTLMPSTAQARTIKHFQHNIQGVIPGRSNATDVVNKLGKPITTKKVAGSTNYHYQNMIVNVNKKGMVNSLIFNKSSRFHDINGIRVGDRLSKVKAKVGQSAHPQTNGKYLIDNKRGIIYWLNNNRVSKIVLAESFYTD